MPDFAARCALAGTTPATVAKLAGRTPSTGTGWASGRSAVPPEIDAWLDRRIADPVPRLDAYRPIPPQLRTLPEGLG